MAKSAKKANVATKAPAKAAGNAAPKKKAPARAGKKGLSKVYLKTGGECRVTFKLPREAAPDARKVTLVGDFNNWDKKSTPMKKLKAGDFSVTVKLQAGQDYRFKYLIDGSRWENDWQADRYEPNAYFGDDSVVAV